MIRQVTTMVALMEWTVATKRADLHAASRGDASQSAADLQSSLSRLGASNVAMAGRVAQLGSRVDVSAIPLRVDLDPDAEALYLLAERLLPRQQLTIVLQHALQRSRPDWGEGLLPWQAGPELIWTKRDAPGYASEGGSLVWHQAGEAYWPRIRMAGGAKGRSAPWCPVIYHDGRGMIRAKRKAWGLWWSGLNTLRQAIVNRGAVSLKRWQVDSLGAEPEPWRLKGPNKILDKGLPS